jgi:hypothetical protein
MKERPGHSTCQDIYVHLLRMRGISRVYASFVRDLQRTERCDAVGEDLSDLRRAYRECVGEDAFCRIMDHGGTLADDRRARQAIVRHHLWTERALVSCLTMSNKVWYYVVTAPRRLQN